MAERKTRAAVQPAAAEPPGRSGLSPAAIFRAGREQAVDEARALVRDTADSQRRKVVETLGGVAQALHKTAQDLGGENKPMAHYTDMAAERLDDMVSYLRQSSWNDMVEDAEDLARRQPWWVIGGAVAAGFIAARVLKGALAEDEAEISALPSPAITGGAELASAAGDLP